MQTNKWKQRGFFGFSKCNLYFSEYQRHYSVTVTTQTFAYKPQCIFIHLKNTPHLSCTLSHIHLLLSSSPYHQHIAALFLYFCQCK